MKGIRAILVILLLISCSVGDIQANQENDVLGTTQSSQSIEASNLSGAEWPWAHGCSCTFNDMVNADDGDLYVTGTFSDSMTLGDYTLTSRGGYDIFIGKVQSTGEWDWVVQAGGGGNDQGRFVAKAGQSNIVAYGFFSGTSTFGSDQHTSTSDSGSTVGTGSNRDLFISLLDEDGHWQWTKTAGGSNGYGDEPGGLAVDSQSNIYIAGSFVGDITLGSSSFTGDGNFDGFIAKLTPEGSWAFANHIGGNYNQEPMQLSIHNEDGVIVYGEYTRQAVFDSVNISTEGDRDVFVAKVEASGAWGWVSSAGGPHRDDASAVDVDSSGNILVAGRFRGEATFGPHSLESPVHMEYEAFLAKLTPDGEWNWSLMIDKAPDTDLRVKDIKFNPKDNILIAGEFEEFLDLNIVNLTAENRDDLFFASLDQDSQWHWGVAYGGNGWDSADVVSIDDAANIYIGGNYDYSIQIEDHFLNQTNDDGDGSFVGFFQLDTDGDGYNDGVDDLPNDPEEWYDVDGDGVGDNTDAFPQDSSEWLDSDGDGVGDNKDVFPNDSTESVDTDGDGKGNNADNDDDNDGYTDVHETSECMPSSDPLDASSRPRDFDQDGICDSIDDDMDGDGWVDVLEEECGTYWEDVLSVPEDTDGDGRCNGMDNDDDGDGINDALELRCSTDPLDALSVPLDTDGDGTCDLVDEDDDGDTWLDGEEEACGTDPVSSTSIPMDVNENSICDNLEEVSPDTNKTSDFNASEDTQTNETKEDEALTERNDDRLAFMNPQVLLPSIGLLVVFGLVLTYFMRRTTTGNQREQSLPNHVEDYISQLVAMGYPEDYAREYAKSQLEAQHPKS